MAVRKQLPSVSMLCPSDAMTWSLTWQFAGPAALAIVILALLEVTLLLQ